MVKVNGTFYTAQRLRRDTTPVSPPYDGSEGQQPPVTPSVRTTPPVAIRYASEAEMIADQINQRSGYLYFDGTNTWWYLGVANGVIGDYQEFGGDSIDTNAVHYNITDGKNSTEKLQARNNIGSTSATPQVIATAGAINNLAVTSNHLVFTGANVVLSGIVAGLNGEEITLLNASGTDLTILEQSTLSSDLNRFASSVVIPNLSVLRIKYRTTTNRWFLENVGINDGRYIRKSGNFDEDINGIKTFRGRVNEVAAQFHQSNSGLPIVNFLGSGDTIVGQILGSGNYSTVGDIFAKRIETNTNGTSKFRNNNSGLSPIQVRNSSDTTTFWQVQGSGRIIQGVRSGAATEQTRRDEQRLFYLNSIVTSGLINNQALTDGIFNYRFTLATSITGFANGEIGRSIIIQNDNTVNLDLTHEDVSSIAANRINLIGGVTLSIPTKGKVTLIYCTGNRWELLSKNF